MITPLYRRIFITTFIVGLIGYLLLFFLLPEIKYANGLGIGIIAGMIDFLIIIIFGTNIDSFRYKKSSIMANRTGRMLFLISIVVIAFIFPDFFYHLCILFGILVIKCVIVIVSLLSKK